MKTIKFRAWCQGKHDNLTFGKAHMEYGVSIGGKGGYLDIESGWDIHGEYLTVPLMQFTGLKDKNGKEIYEGDIAKWTTYPAGAEMGPKENTGIVEYGAGSYVVGTAHIDYFLDEGKMDFEVIGNIYENKNLLKD